jgi:transcriptional regulator with XRE-family HTH domain
MTQAEVAKKAGLDSNSYAKLERGTTRPFGVTLIKICKALEIKSSDILPV